MVKKKGHKHKSLKVRKMLKYFKEKGIVVYALVVLFIFSFGLFSSFNSSSITGAATSFVSAGSGGNVVVILASIITLGGAYIVINKYR